MNVESGSIAEDHIRRQAKRVEVPAAADEAELAGQAELPPVVDLDAGAQGQRQLVVSGDAVGAEVEHVAALEAELALAAVERVIGPVQFGQREEAAQTADVVIEMDAGEDEVG